MYHTHTHIYNIIIIYIYIIYIICYIYILYRYTIRTKIINHKNHNHQSYNHDDVTIIFPIRHAICSARGLPDDRNERAPGPGAYDVHEKLGASAGCNDLVSTCFDWKSGPYGPPGIHGFIIGLSSFYLWTWPFWGGNSQFRDVGRSYGRYWEDAKNIPSVPLQYR
jgi:hypothetical protein